MSLGEDWKLCSSDVSRVSWEINFRTRMKIDDWRHESRGLIYGQKTAETSRGMVYINYAASKTAMSFLLSALIGYFRKRLLIVYFRRCPMFWCLHVSECPTLRRGWANLIKIYTRYNILYGFYILTPFE